MLGWLPNTVAAAAAACRRLLAGSRRLLVRAAAVPPTFSSGSSGSTAQQHAPAAQLQRRELLSLAAAAVLVGAGAGPALADEAEAAGTAQTTTYTDAEDKFRWVGKAAAELVALGGAGRCGPRPCYQACPQQLAGPKVELQQTAAAHVPALLALCTPAPRSITVPAGWEQGAGAIGEAGTLTSQQARFSNAAGLRRVVAFVPAGKPQVSVAVTVQFIGPDYTKLGSFGTATDFATVRKRGLGCWLGWLGCFCCAVAGCWMAGWAAGCLRPGRCEGERG